uniref:Chemosensory protein 7 n=1 Tax=Oedaleus asiaticus TaxID=244712 RepID=A0A2D1AC22_9ORTH|nr:chemosensory protein 7 [Oedaleus asiaticus]
MRNSCLAVALLTTVAVVCGGYTTKYDNFDVDQVLHNDRLLKRYHECLVSDSDAACTVEGKELKSVIPDALQTDCSQCNEKQKAQAEKVISFLIHNKPDLWQSLQNKYDPDGSYRKRHDAELKKLSS